MNKITYGLFVVFITVFSIGIAAVSGGNSNAQPIWLISSAILCILTLISLIIKDIRTNNQS